MAAACGGGDGGSTAATATLPSTSTTAATTTTVDPATAVARAVATVVEGGTGRYHAEIRSVAGGVTDTVTHEVEWDATAGLIEFHVREVTPGRTPSDTERTVIGDRGGTVWLRDPVDAPDPSRPWLRLDPGVLPGGTTAYGLPPVPAPGDPPTPLVAALADAVAVTATDDGYRVEVPMERALGLAQADAWFTLHGPDTVTQVLAALPPTLAVDVTIDVIGRVGGSADVTAIVRAVGTVTGEFDVDGELGVTEVVYREEIRSVGGTVHIPLPAPEEIDGGGA